MPLSFISTALDCVNKSLALGHSHGMFDVTHLNHRKKLAESALVSNPQAQILFGMT